MLCFFFFLQALGLSLTCPLIPLLWTSPRRGEETSGNRSLELTIFGVEMSSSTFIPLLVTGKA
ncbi:hypothetical protein AGR7A_Lc180001 [Agrobacterium deltaense NCPPB 1641]|uniref:Uncharacterized protein n=1 Tax=Agrobacterium deltaense NCPPB 1641 TaxID=1183425 RepID=A0A1S7U3D5_9HYPH|nr:hypothetical protein AGR7A_Lc180001 [Agrobacterium deltaense NCPPB 1641]